MSSGIRQLSWGLALALILSVTAGLTVESRGQDAPEQIDVGGTERELSAARALAELNRQREREQSAIERARIARLQSYEFTLRGPNEAAVMRDAVVRALQNTAAQLYYDEFILLGRHLLAPYLGVNGDRFVPQRKVLEKRTLANGMVEMRVRIGVDVNRFYEDLREKHFVAKPKIRPVVAVLLKEVYDGEVAELGKARPLLEEKLLESELRIESERMIRYGLNQNVSLSQGMIREAASEAQRRGIDAILTGTLNYHSRGDRIVLYDQFFFADADLTLRLIRVDNGEVLREVKTSYSASGPTPETARQKLLDSLFAQAADKLTEGLLEEWANTMLDKTDYRLMISGVDAETLTTIKSMLKTLSPGVKIYQKAFYGDVAVLNLELPEGKPGELEAFLRNSRAPQFRVVSEQDRRFKLDVL